MNLCEDKSEPPPPQKGVCVDGLLGKVRERGKEETREDGTMKEEGAEREGEGPVPPLSGLPVKMR